MTQGPLEHQQRPAPSGTAQSSSWYLDRLAALQKRRTNLEVVRQAVEKLAQPPRIVLKTDLFEEANGVDQILSGLDLGQRLVVGFDLSTETAKGGRRVLGVNAPLFVSDARRLALASDSIDLIISTSTLDHMEDPADLEQALKELYRVLRPGGRMALTLDNPWNPLYPLLRFVCYLPGAPFGMGCTLSRRGLDRGLRKIGFLPTAWRPILHNPRVVSTLYFMMLRRLLPENGADLWIARSLKLFDHLERLPTRWLTGCFVAVCATKPEA